MNEIRIKTDEEISIMRECGKIAASCLDILEENIKPGIETKELDKIAEEKIISFGGVPSFKNYHGFPAATCISVNSVVVHGIPGDYALKEGDIVGVDVGVNYKGFHTDTAKTFGCGQITPEAQNLIHTAKDSLDLAIKHLKIGVHLGDIQFLIQKRVEDAGFSVIRDLTGHGVGKELQEAPSIPNYGKEGTGPVLQEGMVLAIEPMVAEGDWHIKVLPDGWTIVTQDGSLASHFEHSIAITQIGPEVLTK